MLESSSLITLPPHLTFLKTYHFKTSNYLHKLHRQWCILFSGSCWEVMLIMELVDQGGIPEVKMRHYFVACWSRLSSIVASVLMCTPVRLCVFTLAYPGPKFNWVTPDTAGVKAPQVLSSSLNFSEFCKYHLVQ